MIVLFPGMLVLRCIGGIAVCVVMQLVRTCAAPPLCFAAYGGSAVCIVASQYARVEGPPRIDVTARLHLRKAESFVSLASMTHFLLLLTPAVVKSPVFYILVRPARGQGRGHHNRPGKWAAW